MAHDPVRTTDVALGVECALPAGFEAWDSRGAMAKRANATLSHWPRLALDTLLLICLTFGAWHFHA